MDCCGLEQLVRLNCWKVTSDTTCRCICLWSKERRRFRRWGLRVSALQKWSHWTVKARVVDLIEVPPALESGFRLIPTVKSPTWSVCLEFCEYESDATSNQIWEIVFWNWLSIFEATRVKQAILNWSNPKGLQCVVVLVPLCAFLLQLNISKLWIVSCRL